MSNIEIILLFYLIIFCYASTEDKYMLKYFSYGTSNSFDFCTEYETYILRGEIQNPFNSLDFSIYSSVKITDIRYLFSSIEYNYPEDMSINSFVKANTKYANYTINHEYTFTASNYISTKYLYILISISPAPPTDITIYVKSTYHKIPDSNSSSSSSSLDIIWLIVFGAIFIVVLIGVAICSEKNGGSTCEGIVACLQCFALCCQILEICKK